MVDYKKAILGTMATLPIFTAVTFGEVNYNGIDISSYQGTVDFAELPTEYKTVYIRAGGGGDFIDSKFCENYKNAMANNIDYGFYYYVTATSTAEAESQAAAFAKIIEGIDYRLRPAMDFENFGTLTKDEINSFGLAFLSKLEELTGIAPVIYSDAYNVQTVWGEDFGKYTLWVADYTNSDNYSEYTLPTNEVWSDWGGYQYTDSHEISGITDKTDGDIFREGVFIDEVISGNDGCGNSGDTGDSYIFYTVKSGDTLWGISQKYGVTVNELAEENGIKNPSLIFVGEVLRISG